MNLEDWLLANDKRLWVENPRMRDVKAEADRDLGKRHSLKKIRETRDKVCKYWKQRRRKRPSLAMALTDRQWERVQWAIIRNRDELIGESIEFAVYFLRDKGVPASIYLLKNSCTYKHLCGQAVHERETISKQSA